MIDVNIYCLQFLFIEQNSEITFINFFSVLRSSMRTFSQNYLSCISTSTFHIFYCYTFANLHLVFLNFCFYCGKSIYLRMSQIDSEKDKDIKREPIIT